MNTRRHFVTLIGGAAAWPLASRAEQPAMPVVGLLAAPSPPYAEYVASVRQGLRGTGYVEGYNVTIEYRWAEGQYSRLPALAADLVKRQVAVIVTMGGPAPVTAAMAATSSIPILFHFGGDPVQAGFVNSFNRPGGNVTGAVFLALTVAAKRLGLLHELLPTATMIGLLVNPRNPNAEPAIGDLRAAAGTLGLRLLVVHASTESDIDAAFASLVQQRASALIVNPDPFLLTRRQQITALAARQAIPAMYPYREYPDAGGLASYGASIADAYRLVGTYAGRILKGEKPADLPVQQSTKFELVINLKTSKALGLRVPATLLASADEVIE